jgi:hypothetical protein
MGKTFIYALIDPDTGKVRYVGKSDNPKKRLDRHIAGYEPRPTHKSIWIRSLLSLQKKPRIIILEEVESDEWQTAERKWIKFYKEQGVGLTNTADGVEGGHVRDKEGDKKHGDWLRKKYQRERDEHERQKREILENDTDKWWE